MNNEKKRKNLLEEIKKIETQSALLDRQKRKLICELDTLSQEKHPSYLATYSNPIEKRESIEYCISEKIKVFRNLFRGRDDVYARLWISRKTGKIGYSPVCKNEWMVKICKTPIIKCLQCANRELVPLDNGVIRKHLIGEHVVGIYPMLQDETCYFLAVDFDREDWVDNVFAFKETCSEEGVPVAIERSRSGNGAHAWIFFKENISVTLARRLGSFLITKTMSKRYQLDMRSYDRLFPSQDTLPRGGFGNLIALPFQAEVAKQGNSVFIDENCVPFRDQWKFLYTLERMSFGDVEKIVKEAVKAGQIIGARMSPISESDPPWMWLPSGKRRYKTIIANLPEVIELVIANRIYIKTNNVPSVLLNQLKQLAAFQNPEFYKRQNMRLSTFLTPRIICCAEILEDYLSLPRGCFEEICFLMNEYGIKFDIKDKRIIGKKAKFRFQGSLSKKQQSISRKIIKNDVGVLVAPPGTGKTVMAINTIAKRKTNTLILVHRKPLMEQWKLQLASFLEIDLKAIGQIGAGRNKANGILDIAMIQSMERKGVVDDRIADYGFIIVDECHHVSAVSFERVLMQAKAKYILGLTATPYRRDGHQPIIHMQCGPIVSQVKQKEINEHIFQYCAILRKTRFFYEWSDESNIYNLWPQLIKDVQRNQMIVDDIKRVVGEGRFPIILTERREHLEILEHMLQGIVEHLAVLHGGLRIKRRQGILRELYNCSSDRKKALLATGAYIGEGFDDPRLDTLFIAMPISFKGKVVQYAGRLHRQYQGKRDVYIYDYIDEDISVLARMYQKRLKAYKAMGYELRER